MLKQFGSSSGERFRIHLAKLACKALFLCFSSTRAIPGRRTLISEFSLAGKSTGEVKYITPGWDKGWVDKHKGVATVLFSGCTANTYGNPGYRT